MAKKKTINRVTSLNILSTVILQGISFFSAPIFSRMMGTANYGVYVSFLTWSSIITCIFSLQVSASLMMAATSVPKKDQEKYQSSTLFLSFCSFTIFFLLGWGFKDTVTKILNLPEELFFFIFAFSFVQMIISFATAKYTAEFKAEKHLVLSVSSSLLGVLISLALFYVVDKDVNYLARIVGTLIPNAAIALIVCVPLFWHGRTFVRADYWKACLYFSIPFIFHTLSGTILSQSDRVMIQRMLGDSDAGIYSLTYSYSGIITIIYTALNSSWAPFYLKYLSEEKAEEIASHSKTYVELFTVLCIGFILLSPEVFKLFAGKEFWEGTDYIILLVVANYFIFLYSFPVNFEYYCKSSSIIAGATVAAALLNLVMNYFLIISMGAIGAVIATLFSNMLLFAVHYFCAKVVLKAYKYPLSLKAFLPSLTALLLASAVCGALGDNWAGLRWSIGAVLGVFELYRMVKRKAII